MDHIILCGIFASFNGHIYFDNSVFLLRYLWLKSFLWFPNQSLKVVAVSPKYIFFHCRFHYQHLFDIFWRGQMFFTLQLHPYLVIFGWSNDLLCPATIDDILLMQLKLIFTLFLLKILCNLFFFGKCFFRKLKNILPMFVFTLTE